MTRKRWIWFGAAVGAVLVVAIAFWAWTGPIAYARIATGYVAQQTCACINVSNRSFDACKADFNPDDIKALTMSVTDQTHVRVEVLGGLISANAVAESGYGCRLID